MKHLGLSKKLATTAIAAALGLGVIACEVDENGVDDGVTDDGVDDLGDSDLDG